MNYMFELQKEIVDNKEQYYVICKDNEFTFISRKEHNRLLFLKGDSNNFLKFNKYYWSEHNIKKMKYLKKLFLNNIYKYKNYNKDVVQLKNYFIYTHHINLKNQNKFIEILYNSINEYIKIHLMKHVKNLNLGVNDIVIDEMKFSSNVPFKDVNEEVDKEVDVNDDVAEKIDMIESYYCINLTYKFIVNEKFNEILKYQFNEDEYKNDKLLNKLKNKFNLDSGYSLPKFNSYNYLLNYKKLNSELNESYMAAELERLLKKYIHKKIKNTRKNKIEKGKFSDILYKNCLKNKL